jgi:predicted metal-dependent hydrolase
MHGCHWVESPCPVPTLLDSFARGARLFDAGAFFEAHEAWEEQWRVEPNLEAKRALQGLIQIAAGFHKLFVVGDRAAAARLLAKALAKLDAGDEGIAGVSIDGFREEVRGFARALESGEERIARMPRMGMLEGDE